MARRRQGKPSIKPYEIEVTEMLKVGKLDSDMLKEMVIDKITYRRPEVLTKAGVGEDCAVIDYGEYECVVSTDPITADIDQIGKLAIHISCNDIASNGVEPLGILLAVMLPVGTTEEDIATIMEQAGEAAKLAQVEIIGGHTEITEAVNKPVIVSTAFGRGFKGQSQSAVDMAPGDYILMTKTAGIEGTGIIADDHEEKVRSFLTEDEIKYARGLLGKVSVVKEGVIAGKIGTNGMHDITEGGVLGAVWELCNISGMGAEVWIRDIPVEDVTRKIAEHFGIDYLRLISSGSMLIISSPERKEEIIQALKKEGILATVIGKITEGGESVNTFIDGTTTAIEPPGTDELYKVI